MSRNPQTPLVHFRIARSRTRLACIVSLALFAAGCASAAKQVAKTAAPAAVEGAVEKASEPSTRDAVAEILEDPDIRSSTTQLSEAVATGLTRAVKKEVPMAQVQRLTDTVVSSAGASMADSLERDLAPRLSFVIGQVVDESFERALSEQSQARLQALVATTTRATLAGAHDAFSQIPGDDQDPLSSPAAHLTRNAWFSLGYNGAQGFERAVGDAHRQHQEDGQPSVLALLGAVASLANALPVLLLTVVGMLVFGLTVALVWALVALRRERRWAYERETARQEAWEPRPVIRGTGSGTKPNRGMPPTKPQTAP